MFLIQSQKQTGRYWCILHMQSFKFGFHYSHKIIFKKTNITFLEDKLIYNDIKLII